MAEKEYEVIVSLINDEEEFVKAKNKEEALDKAEEMVLDDVLQYIYIEVKEK